MARPERQGRRSNACARSPHRFPEDSPYVHSEYAAIKDTVLEMSKGSFEDLFTTGPDRHFCYTWIRCSSKFLALIITYYIPNVLQQQAGLSKMLAKLIAACNGDWIFYCEVAMFTVERFGRRPLVLFRATEMSISMIILAITDSIGGTEAGIGQTVCLFVFNTFFAIGWLGMTWLYPGR